MTIKFEPSNDLDTYVDNAFKILGVEKQSIIVMEECSELIKEVSKMLRGKDNKKEIAEECSHVYLMIMQLASYLGIQFDINNEYYKSKLRVKQICDSKLKEELNSLYGG